MLKKNTSISLGEPFVEFAQRKVASGEFGSTSEVVREAMRRYVAYDAEVTFLRREIQRGLDSGIAEPLDWDAFMEEHFGAEDEA